jgi:hypothetical protein
MFIKSAHTLQFAAVYAGGIFLGTFGSAMASYKSWGNRRVDSSPPARLLKTPPEIKGG